MAEKSADIHTIAPRTAWLEDAVDDLYARSGGGGGDDPSPLLQQLYLQTVGLSHTDDGAFSTDIWDADSVYKDPYGERSIHVALFGFSGDRRDLTNVETCLNETRGFYNQVFATGDTRWSGWIGGNPPLSVDVFGTGEEYLGSLRTSGRSLIQAIFKDPSYIPGPGSIGAANTVMGRIEQLENRIEQLENDVEEALTDLRTYVDGELQLLRDEDDAIKVRLAAGGL